MKMREQTRTNETKTGRKTFWLLRFLLLGTVILLCSAAGFAGTGHGKLAPDLSTFPTNPDGTVDVIIQFKDTMQAKHFQIMASRGGRLKNRFEHINGAAYRIPVKLLAFLENHPDIAYVTPDRPNTSAFDSSSAASDVAAVSAITADVARIQYRFDGTGIGMAVIDSGVFSHDDLNSGSGSRIVYSESFVAGDTSTNDAYGHGTHVAGIIGGNGQDSASGYPYKYHGIAPNVNIINLRVLNGQGAGNDSQVIAAIQRAIQLKATYNIRVMNLSLGRPVFESYTLDPLCQAVESAWQAGIVVVVAAGNSGRDNSHGTRGYGTIQAPGNDPNVITVGATKDWNTATRLDDTVASFSSKGPTAIDHIVKPDIVAPGNRIVSLLAPGSYLATLAPNLAPSSPLLMCDLNSVGVQVCNTDSSAKYLRLSGTSMATPFVAGAAALMIQKDPTLTPDTIKARMMKTAWKGYPSNSWAYDFWGYAYFAQYDVFTIGAGYLDVDAAMSSTDVANGGATSPVAVRNALTGKVSLINSKSITWGSSIVWDNSIVWSDTIVWGSNTVLTNSILWGDTIVWGDTTTTGFSIIWGDSIVWGIDGMAALSNNEDGEN